MGNKKKEIQLYYLVFKWVDENAASSYNEHYTLSNKMMVPHSTDKDFNKI